jgi:AhpD family alkylhydroperoxidase
MSRIEPADVDAAELREIVQLVYRERGVLGELYPQLMHSPAIAEGMIALGNGVRKKSSLPAMLRELVICRVGIVNGAAYEVLRHRQIAEGLGETMQRLDDLADWAVSRRFDYQERSALQLADSMTRDIAVSDEVFEPLRNYFDDRQILELTVTIAYYNMISRVLVALRIS